MKNISRLLPVATLSAAILAGSWATLPTAAVADGGAPATSGCIDYREFKTMQPGTMSEIQTAVDADGPVIHTQFHGDVVLKQYRWCGHWQREGYVQVSYYRNVRGELMGQYVILFDYTDDSPLQHQPEARHI